MHKTSQTVRAMLIKQCKFSLAFLDLLTVHYCGFEAHFLRLQGYGFIPELDFFFSLFDHKGVVCSVNRKPQRWLPDLMN